MPEARVLTFVLRESHGGEDETVGLGLAWGYVEVGRG
jgi:hypothetical protein